MRRPWQIWTLYALTLLVVVPAMVWLSLQSLKLEQAREQDRVETELARREAELQERVSSALWRMDGFLTNLIAREATRPWYLYQSFYDVAAFEPQEGFGSGQQAILQQAPQQVGSAEMSYRLASPLLFQPSDFVRLHFEIDRTNFVTSPQIPDGVDRSQAISHGLTNEQILQNKKRIRDIKIMCEYHQMLADCSTSLLPDAPFSDLPDSQQQVAMPDPNRHHRDAQYAKDAPMVLPPAGQADDFSFFRKLQRSLQPEINRFKQKIANNKQTEINPDSFGVRNSRDSGEDLQIVKGGKPQTTKKQLAQQTRNTSRGMTEFSQRQQNADNYAMSEWAANKLIEPQMAGQTSATRRIREGIMQPLWIEDSTGERRKQLVLVRRVVKENQQVIQGCWLDWNKIQTALADLVNDLLPEVHFQSYEDQDQIRWGQVLATLPVQLVIDRPKMIEMLKLSANSADQRLESDLENSSLIRRSLWIAWGGLIFAAFAGAFLLQGVLRLSERRGAFVSAVSHELRTPLTTFRMYAEMLAEKMVPAEKQQQYAETLKVESERLWHLVENVLQFARLERSNQKRRLEEVALSDVLPRFTDRLNRRAEHAGMKLKFSIPDEVLEQEMKTDPGAIEQILFNLVDNACKYAREATDRRIEISGELSGSGRMQLSVRDHGPGVKKQDRHRMFQPFRKSDIEAANSAQGVGLGLALCRRMAKSLGGKLVLEELGNDEKGTRMTLEIPVRS